MTGQINYRTIDVPEDEDPENYHYTVRRAEILQVVEEAGHPKMVNQTGLARRYGCSRQNVGNDLDVLADFIDETMGARRALETNSVIRKCVTELMDEGRYRQAAQTQLDFNKWLDDYRDQEEFEDRLVAVEEHLTNDESVRDLDGLTTNGNGVDLRKNR